MSMLFEETREFLVSPFVNHSDIDVGVRFSAYERLEMLFFLVERHYSFPNLSALTIT